MGLLDEHWFKPVEFNEEPKKPSQFISRRRTRRGKKKKKIRDSAWRKKVEKAKIAHQEEKKARQQLAEHWRQANRLIETE